MKAKKMMAAAMSAMLLFLTVSVCADTLIDSLEVTEGGRITAVIAAETYERVAVKVQQKDGTLLGFVGEAAADEDGKVVFEFQMTAAAPAGEYVLSYCEGENDAKQYPFAFADITDFLAELNAADNAQTVLDLLKSDTGNENAAKVMGIDTEQYSALGEQEQLQVAKQYLELRKGTAQAENVEAFSKALGIQISDRNKSKALELYNPEFEGEKFNDLTDDARKQWLVETLTVSEKTSEGFERAYGQAQAVYKFLNAKSAEIGTLIGKYETILGLANSPQYTKYAGFLVEEKGKTHDYIAENIGNAKTAQEVLNVFEKAVSAAGVQGNNGNGGGNGSGGSSGNRGGSSGSGTRGDIVIGSDFNSGNENKLTFYDLSGYDWANKAVYSLAERNVISGYGDGSFRPGQIVTREEFVKMAVCVAGIYNVNAKCSFADVSDGEWYYSYIASGAERGIISGISDDLFGTGASMTRQDMAVIVCRLAENRGISLTQKRSYANYSDEEAIAGYAKESVKKLYTAGMINGMAENSFAPLEQTTRAQAAKILYDVFYNGKGAN